MGSLIIFFDFSNRKRIGCWIVGSGLSSWLQVVSRYKAQTPKRHAVARIVQVLRSIVPYHMVHSMFMQSIRTHFGFMPPEMTDSTLANSEYVRPSPLTLPNTSFAKYRAFHLYNIGVNSGSGGCFRPTDS
jgi:hypothetical protein